MFHLNLSCNHCESPPAWRIAPRAPYKDDDGTVQHDDEACIGCQTCVNSCPYGAPSSSRRTRSSRSATPAGRCARRGHEPVRGGVPYARHRVWRNGRFARRPSRCG